MKKYSTLLIYKEVKIKTMARCLLTHWDNQFQNTYTPKKKKIAGPVGIEPCVLVAECKMQLLWKIV